MNQIPSLENGTVYGGVRGTAWEVLYHFSLFMLSSLLFRLFMLNSFIIIIYKRAHIHILAYLATF